MRLLARWLLRVIARVQLCDPFRDLKIHRKGDKSSGGLAQSGELAQAAGALGHLLFTSGATYEGQVLQDE